MIGVTLVSLVILVLWELFLRSNMALSHTLLLREGGDLAQGFLNKACSRPFGTYAPDTTSNLGSYGTQPFEAVLRVLGPPDPYLKQVRVEVRWLERNQPHVLERSACVVNITP